MNHTSTRAKAAGSGKKPRKRPAKPVKKKRNSARPAKKLYRNAAVFALVVALLGIVAILAGVQVLSKDLPSLEKLETYKPRLITRVLDANGETIKEFYTERRVVVPLDSISPHLVDAVLATEDRRYFSHWGIDPIGIMRAMTVNMLSMSTREGASTITQQLARNLYLHRRQTIRRKLREMITAVQIERTYSKEEILEIYFTHMYFGHGAYGIESASDLYFGKKASQLTPPEAAMIVGLLKAPNNYTPLRHPEKALARRNLVLALMERAGYINDQELDRYRRTPVTLAGEKEDQTGVGPYFTEWVRQRLEELQQEYGFDYYRDGLVVQSTLDADLQRAAETAIDSHLVTFQASFNKHHAPGYLLDILTQEYADSLLDATGDTLSESLKSRARGLARKALRDSSLADSLTREHLTVQVAFVAMDPSTGDVLSLVGGRDFQDSKFNRATQATRQPGSVFKPFVYTTAIDNGFYPNYQILNMVQPVLLEDGTWWRPENYDVTNRGEMVSLRNALRQSLNNVTVRMVAGDSRIVPIREIIRYAHRMGIRTRLQAVPSLALGAIDLVPIDVVTAYGVFASGGARCRPRFITSIDDHNGQQLARFPVRREVVLSPETAAIMVDLLGDVINRGTGGSARWKYGFRAPAGGKTGTTNNFNNAWFVGFTPHIVAGVWVGFDNPAISLGPGQTGSSAALPIWAIFMNAAYDIKGWPNTEFELPVGVVEVPVCEDSGMLAGPTCPHVYEELFRRGDEPRKRCTMHPAPGG